MRNFRDFGYWRQWINRLRFERLAVYAHSWYPIIRQDSYSYCRGFFVQRVKTEMISSDTGPRTPAIKSSLFPCLSTMRVIGEIRMLHEEIVRELSDSQQGK